MGVLDSGVVGAIFGAEVKQMSTMDNKVKNSEDSAIYNMLYCFFSVNCETCTADFEVDDYDIKDGDVESWAREQSKKAKSAGWYEISNEVVYCPSCTKLHK